jgi:SAM-dependent methyltransferase
MAHASSSQHLQGAPSPEQDRLLRMNRFLNPTCLQKLGLGHGERILEVGSGTGIFAREMARAIGAAPPVVCVERDEAQIYRTLELAAARQEEALLDVRQGEPRSLPLHADEWGSFDLVHCRFVLQHLADPQDVVRGLGRALRPGGRLVLIDDDHDLVRLWPSMPAIDELWRARAHAVIDRGHDPFVGRKLIALMQLADLQPTASDQLFFGGCSGHAQWDLVAANFADVLRGSRVEILAATAIAGDLFDEVVDSLVPWSRRPDAALWYPVCWAVGRRPE